MYMHDAHIQPIPTPCTCRAYITQHKTRVQQYLHFSILYMCAHSQYSLPLHYWQGSRQQCTYRVYVYSMYLNIRIHIPTHSYSERYTQPSMYVCYLARTYVHTYILTLLHIDITSDTYTHPPTHCIQSVTYIHRCISLQHIHINNT